MPFFVNVLQLCEFVFVYVNIPHLLKGEHFEVWAPEGLSLATDGQAASSWVVSSLHNVVSSSSHLHSSSSFALSFIIFVPSEAFIDPLLLGWSKSSHHFQLSI